jgi:hypothetical protein
MPQTHATSGCFSCPLGQVMPNTGAAGCIQCPANTYAPSTGMMTCTPCPAGKTSLPGSYVCN